MTGFAMNGRGGSPSPGKSAARQPIELEVLKKLLQERGWTATSKCLQEEVFTPFRSSEDDATTAKEKVDELLAPAMEENLRSHVNSAMEAEREQRQQLAAVAEQALKQGQKMSEVRNLLNRMRDVAAMTERPSVEELEVSVTRKDMEIHELEAICSERDALIQTLRLEVAHFDAESSAIRKQLEDREDYETNARISLTRIEDELRRLAAEVHPMPVSTQARKIQALLVDWHDHGSHLQSQVRSLFNDIDSNRDGRLEWNNSEIRTFVHEIFKRNGILWPNWQEAVFYDMYRRADVDHSYSLEFKEAADFAKRCFESALALVLTGQSDNGHDLIADYQHVSQRSIPVEMAASHQPAMTYSSGVVINFVEFSNAFAPVFTANQAHHPRMIRIIETGEHLKATMRTYRECDKDGNGRLTWNNGEVRDFIAACFVAHGLTPPHEDQMYHMYSKFDKDRNNYLDMRECLEMVDALFRSTFVVEAQAPVTQVRRESVSSPISNSEVRKVHVQPVEVHVQPVHTALPEYTTQQVVRMVSPTTRTLRSASPVVAYPRVVQQVPGSSSTPQLIRSASGSLVPIGSTREIPVTVISQSPRQHSSRPGSPVGTRTMAVSHPTSPTDFLVGTGRISPTGIFSPPTAPPPGTTWVVPTAQNRTLSPPLGVTRVIPGNVSPASSFAGSLRAPIQSNIPLERSVSGTLSSFGGSLEAPIQRNIKLERSVSGTSLHSAKSSLRSVSSAQTASGALLRPRPATLANSNRVMSGSASAYKQLSPVLSRSRR